MDDQTNLAMGVASPEDLELFQRVMRTMQLLQSRVLVDPPSAPSDSKAPRGPYVEILPDTVDFESYDEDEESDDEFEYDAETSDGDNEDMITDEYESEASHGQGTSIDERKAVYSGHGHYNNGRNDEVGNLQDKVRLYNEMDGDYDSSDSSDTFVYPDEAPPPYSNPQEPPFPLQPPASPPSTAPLSSVPTVAPKQSAVVEADGHGDGDGGLRCWKHGCNGRKFTTRSNLRRHLREKSHARPSCCCPHCGAVFSRTTARNTHVARGSCGRIRRYSNGRIRPHLRVSDKTTS